MILVMMPHQCGISGLASQTSFCEETSGVVMKCRLFSQAKNTRSKAKKRVENTSHI